MGDQNHYKKIYKILVGDQNHYKKCVVGDKMRFLPLHEKKLIIHWTGYPSEKVAVRVAGTPGIAQCKMRNDIREVWKVGILFFVSERKSVWPP